MTISEKDWKNYIARLRTIDRKAADAMQHWMDENPNADFDRMIERAYGLATVYGEASAALACEMYDSLALAQGASAPLAEPAPTATPQETAKAVLGTLNNPHNTVSATVGRLTRQAGADTMLRNAARDGAQFAWIPAGDTCAFCQTLASRGWQRQSKKAAKNHAEHIHANCDCTYAVRFDGKSTVVGYDPEALKEQYDAAEGSSPEEKINAMRRAHYAEHREEINTQKREAYARRIAEKKRLQNNEDRSIIHTQKTILAAKDPRDVVAPASIRGDYQDFLPLEISEESRKGLSELRELARRTDNEHGFAIYQGGRTEIQTNNEHSRVSIGFPQDAKHVEVYHCHTDDSVLSPEDIRQSALRPNVDRECCISANGDIWVIDYSGGIRPDKYELDRAMDACESDAKTALVLDPAYDSWTFEERYYMLGREKLLRTARLFEWKLQGGHING